MTVRLNVPTFERVECVPVHVSIWGYKLEGHRRCGGGSRGELKVWEEPVFGSGVSVTRFGLTTLDFEPP
jgi:hypothetical protein